MEPENTKNGQEIDFLQTIQYILANFSQLSGKLNSKEIDYLKKAVGYMRDYAVQKILEERLVNHDDVLTMLGDAEEILSKRITVFEENLSPEFDASQNAAGVPEALQKHAQTTYDNSKEKKQRDILMGKIADLKELRENFDDPEKFIQTLIVQVVGERLNPGYIRLMNACAENMTQVRSSIGKKETSRTAGDVPLFSKNKDGHMVPNLDAVSHFFEIIRNPSTIQEIEQYNAALEEESRESRNLSRTSEETKRYEKIASEPEHYEEVKEMMVAVCKLAAKRDEVQAKIDQLDSDRKDEYEDEVRRLQDEQEKKTKAEAEKNALQKLVESLINRITERFGGKKLLDPSSIESQMTRTKNTYVQSRDELLKERAQVESELRQAVASYGLKLKQNPLYEKIDYMLHSILVENVSDDFIYGEAEEGSTPQDTFKKERTKYLKKCKDENPYSINSFSNPFEIEFKLQDEVTIQKFRKILELMENTPEQSVENQEIQEPETLMIQELFKAKTEGNLQQARENEAQAQLTYKAAMAKKETVYKGLSEKSQKIVDDAQGKIIPLEGISEKYVDISPAEYSHNISPFVASLVLQAAMSAQNLTAEDLEKYGIIIKEDYVVQASTTIIADIQKRLGEMSGMYKKEQEAFER